MHLLGEETILGWTMLRYFLLSTSGTLHEQFTHRTAFERENYYIIATKVGFRAEKRDNGCLGFHEAPVKFPRAPQRFLLTKLVVKEDVPLASVCSSW